ncbi:family 10 glycosylhydrolase [Polycladomyces subterraneus]|uniref:Family 10 glycosylhydrolase n=1 Tax=Polycladomyces subterraneus TaxID=1016997 RepID=A0ABT8IJZ4_9BACL|nr:family 10 glycosylhydrolase [Polycladomyces subterraneus]MDN4593074.1 family 10 glycosylhydrolase [Polycladomyces subterraneus]
MRMRKWFVCLSLFGWLWMSLVPQPARADSPPREFRAFWVDAFHDGFKTPAQVDKLIADVQKSHANAVIVQVRRRGDAYFNKALEPRTEDPALQPGFDALAYLIEKAHQARPRIEVHAWLATLPIWNSATPPKSPQHVFNTHGPSAQGRDYWLMNRVDGVNRDGANYVLDPGHPDALDYTVEQYLNVVRQYDVDGIHLDLVRYMGPEWGYNPVSVERFQQQTGTSGLPDPQDERWKAWRREQVTFLMRKVYLKAIAIRPDIKVSAAVIAWGAGPSTPEAYRQSAPYTQVMQDWDGWLQKGFIDMAIPMNYDREHVDSQKLWYDQWIEWEKDHQYGRQIVIGPGVYLNAISGSLAQIKRAQMPSANGNRAAGVSLYSYAETNKDSLPNDTLYTSLSQPNSYGEPVFAEQAEIPDMPWKSRPTKGYLMGNVTDAKGQPVDGVTVEIKGQGLNRYESKTDGSGFFGLSDLPPGYYLVKVDGAVPKLVKVKAGRVTETDLQMKK